MTKSLSIILCLPAFLLAAPITSAQAPANQVSAKSDYSKEAAVAELLATRVSFNNDGTSVQELNSKVRIQSDAGVQGFGLLKFTYQGATQTVELDYVRVHKPDGTIVNTPPDNIQDLDAGITREAPFYSDLREKHVAVKGLSIGDTLEYLARWRSKKSLAPGQFWYEYNFEHDAIVLDEELEISLPRDRSIKIKSPLLKSTVSESNDRRVYSWKTTNTENHSKDDETRKALSVSLGRVEPPDVQLSSFQSWDEVGKWYWDLQKERVQPTAEIRSKAAELASGTADSGAVLHSVYDFVSTKFRYIGVAFGIGRYQPHAADDVLGNQYGDCKDKHTLLASLLQADGITVYPALISTGRRLDPDVPSPAQFDHVISVVRQGKDLIWLDTTTEVGPFGYLFPQLRDKQALVIFGDKPAALVTTPANLPYPSIITYKADAKLSDEGTLDSKMEYMSRGDDEVPVRAAFRRVPQSHWNELVQQISFGLGFAGTVSDVTASVPEGTTDPVRFSYVYNRKNYSDWSEHQISMPGLPFSMPEVKQDEAHAKDPIWLGAPTQMTSDAKVEIPLGYNAELPQDVALVRDYAEYRVTYKLEKGVLISHRELLSKLDSVPPIERDDFISFYKQIQEDRNRFIPLIPSTDSVTKLNNRTKKKKLRK